MDIFNKVTFTSYSTIAYIFKNTSKNLEINFNYLISCLEGEVSMVVHAVCSDVLLDVCVLVIVDSEAHVASGPGQVGDQTGLAN